MNDRVGIFLAKASDELVSHCTCENTFVGAPAQMDCPWCGCGWLFVCPQCRKAFAFARAEPCDLSWDQLAHLDLDGKWDRQPDQEEVDEWIDFMQMFTKDLELGKEYAYIDGWVFPIDEQDLQFEGMHSLHDLPSVPQATALSDRGLLEQTLNNVEYWNERKIEFE